MPVIHGFPPICSAQAHTLVLGSMPSRESLKQARYYAHPRNSFWPILSALFEFDGFDYAGRVQSLSHHGIAVWDVLKACQRHDSLDSNIDESSMVTNDFHEFFQGQPGITRIFFNGAKAESVYRRRVLPRLQGEQAGISLMRLPSTSPAHAAMTFTQKLSAWKVLVR